MQNSRRSVLSTPKAGTSSSVVQKQFGETASVAEVKALPLKLEPSTSKPQGIPPSSGFKKEDNANTPEVRKSLIFGEFPSLAEGTVKPTVISMHMGTSGNAWVNINRPDASLSISSPFQHEL